MFDGDGLVGQVRTDAGFAEPGGGAAPAAGKGATGRF